VDLFDEEGNPMNRDDLTIDASRDGEAEESEGSEETNDDAESGGSDEGL
jgi:hypothetical protein